MKMNQAITAASRRAHLNGQTHYVVFSSVGNEPRTYHVATEEELSTLFAGTPAVAVCGRDGRVEYSSPRRK
jgi:hypothetical protein